MNTLGVLLAGGLSRRMGGRDKGMMELVGKPLMEHALVRLQAQVAKTIINANGDLNRFACFNTTIIPDTIDGYVGPLAGVLAGMEHAHTLYPRPVYVLSAASDTPFFPDNLREKLSACARTESTVVIAQSSGKHHPVFGLWPVALADDLREWLTNSDNRKVKLWIERHDWAVAEFDPVTVNGEEIDPFFNINTPEDFAHASLLIERQF